MKIYYTLLLLLFASCAGKSESIDEIEWINGDWHAKVQGNEVFESWERENDSSWIGKSKFVKEGKTLFTELMSIRSRKNKLVFISAVSDQNDAEKITFTEANYEKNKIVFQNKTHDFPQKITYQKKNDQEMLAYISGDLNGKKERIDFNFKKVK